MPAVEIEGAERNCPVDNDCVCPWKTTAKDE